MRIEYGDGWQAAIRDHINALTLSRLIGLGDTSIVFGRFDDDTGDDDASSERIGDDSDDESSE